VNSFPHAHPTENMKRKGKPFYLCLLSQFTDINACVGFTSIFLFVSLQGANYPPKQCSYIPVFMVSYT
jgi:hypothetical protein